MPDIKIMATGLGFPEGPVWMEEGSVILGEMCRQLSDIDRAEWTKP